MPRVTTYRNQFGDIFRLQLSEIGNSCENCGKHIPADKVECVDETGGVYCSKKCCNGED